MLDDGLAQGCVGVALCGEVEGKGDGELGFVEVGDVQDERQGGSGVGEAEGGAGADAGDDRVANVELAADSRRLTSSSAAKASPALYSRLVQGTPVRSEWCA
ncbi:hypothetical protein [Streptomyces achromogenes]|uniref:hypothetical protein n=1 Tax=Streptomyces achromogenes TaxID=67255 RepID=UPI0004C615A5